MVGDGVNDEPALKQADVSVAMSSGSHLASDISSVVMLNNSFTAVHDLLLIGRQTLANIKKIFLFFLISSVFSQQFAVLLSSTLGIPQLYSNFQMTVVSTFTDVIPAIGLFFEKPEQNEWRHRPRERLVIDSRLVIVGLLFLGPLITSLAYLNFFLYFKIYASLNPSDLLFEYFSSKPSTIQHVQIAQTIGFYSIVAIQCFGVLFSIRTRRLLLVNSLPLIKPYKNLAIIFTSLFVFVLTSFLVSFCISGFTQNIPTVFFIITFGNSVLVLVLVELKKACFVRYTRLSYLY